MNNVGKQPAIREIARVFLKLGCIGFGGPAAHIAMMQREVVLRRHWLTEQHFLDLTGATQLIPGPNSTEMAIHIGHEKGGWKGLLTAGICFITPAVIITGIFAWLYKSYGRLPEVQSFVYGIKPAIIAVVFGVAVSFAKKSLKSAALGVIGLAVLLLTLWGVNEIALLFGAGFAGVLITKKRKGGLGNFRAISFPLLLKASGTTASLTVNGKLFWIFLKIGAILYGSGYVLFAFLDAELVASGMLSRTALMDAIAVGQFTPGPVFSAVTFIGYQINGWAGAAVSTIGIFLPSFVFVALMNPLVRKMRRSAFFAAFLDAVNIASVAILFAICYTMGKEAVTDWRTLLIALLSCATVFIFPKFNSAFIVLGGAISGFLLS